MSDETDRAELMRLLAEQQGLERALQRFPEAIRAAAERGLRPLGAFPSGTPPRIQPAGVFDPARFEPPE